MNNWQAGDVLDAAAQTLINERCRRAYMHDMLGGLQAIYSSLELLARSAKRSAPDSALIDNATSIAKRAMANHEQAMVSIVNQVTGPEDAPMVLNLANLIRQAQQLLRNDAAGKGVALGLTGREDLQVFCGQNKLRSLILGLLALGIDASPAGAELHVELSCAGSYALLELRSEVTYDAICEAQELLCREPVNIRPQELVLGFARQWIKANGGRVEIPPRVGAQTGLRIYYPLAPT
jgi:signal transduction histidine kinase